MKIRHFPNILTRFITHLVYIFSVTGFFLIAVLLYEPRSLCELLHVGQDLMGAGSIFPFNISIFCAIILVSLFLTRLIFYILRNRIAQAAPWFIVWCCAETVIVSAFVALYATLMDQGSDNYFVFLGRSFGSMASLFIYPYTIVTLAYYLYDAYNTETVDDDVRLKFYDNRHLLKFVTLKSSILYFEAQANYIHIYYEENGTEKMYSLRNSMRSVEAISARSGFVRTHRSYIVNPAHIRLVAKSSDGHYYATLDLPQDRKIPVSKKYHDNIIRLL